MKKLFVTAVLTSMMFMANAQELMSKKGTPILPEAGDWSIGASADPILRYFGNIFNKDNNNNTLLSPQHPLTLVGLYVKNDKTAYRIKVRLGYNSSSQNNFVNDDAFTGTPPAPKVTDTRKTTAVNIGLGAGFQKTRGKGRLHGIYGVEAGLAVGTSKNTYDYGNKMSSANSTPQSTLVNSDGEWMDTSGTGTFDVGQVSSRVKELKKGTTVEIGVTGFAGIEYFFAPKMSLSAEYGWGIMLNTSGEGENTNETLDSSNNLVSRTTKTGKGSNFSLDVRDIGSIVFHFYF
jgi:hypothetical protein